MKIQKSTEEQTVLEQPAGAEKQEQITEKTTPEAGEKMTTATIAGSAQEQRKKKPVRGDSYISTERDLQNASGLYSISRKPEGGLDIKFDDIKLQKKRNDLKQEITRLRSSGSPEDAEKAKALAKKLAEVETRIRMQK